MSTVTEWKEVRSSSSRSCASASVRDDSLVVIEGGKEGKESLIVGFVKFLHSVCTLASSLSARNLNSPLLLAIIVTAEEMFFSRSTTVLRAISPGMMIDTYERVSRRVS